MVALGPRVGGAHVDVNLKFDDKSIGKVGKQIHRQLSRLGDSLAKVGDRNREVYRSIGRDTVTAWRALLGTMVAGAPLAGSAISGLAGAVTMLAGALYSAVQSSYGLTPLLAAIGVAAGTAAIGMNGFIEAVKSGDMSKLTPEAKASAKAVRSLSGAWQRLRDTVQERMFKGLADDIRRLGNTLFPVLEKGLGKMADALNGLAKDMLRYLNSSAGLKVINSFLDNSADIFRRLSKAAVPFLDGFLKLLNALAPAGKRLADRIADIAKRFQEWASAPGFAKRIDDMMKRAEKTAGLLFKMLGNLGAAIRNIFDAANPATNTFLQMLVDVTQRFKEWSASAEGRNSIAEWAENSVEVMRQFGKTLEAVFKVMAELSDPRVIISFLKTVEEAFNYLGQLPLDSMVNAFVRLAEALQPVSSLFLAIIIASAAFNVIIGSVIGQLGGLFSALGRIVKPLERLFKPLSSAGKHGKEITGLAAAFGRVAVVAARLAKFIPFVGWAIWIGSVVAKSDELQEKFGEVWESVKGVGSAISDAFEEIGEALEPLAPAAEAVGSAFEWLFGILDKILGFGIGLVLDAWAYAFDSLAKVIKGAGKIIAGFIEVLIGLFTLDFEKMWDGLRKMASGIGPLLEGIFGLFVSVFAPARLARLGFLAIRGLAGGIKKALPGILSAVGRFIGDVLRFFVSLAPRLLTLGAQAFSSLASAIGRALPGVLAAAGRVVTGILRWIGRLPGQLFALAGQAMSRMLSAFTSAAPKIIAAAGRIFTGVVGWIARLPGRLLTLGRQAITRLAGAVTAGIGRLRGIASSIFRAVISALSGLPGRLLSIGQQAISRLAGAVSAGIGRLRGIANSIKNAIVDAVKGIPGQMLSIGRSIISNLTSGITAGLGKLKSGVSKIGGLIKGILPGSPVEYGPLTAWNHGSGATGGGRNVIEAITSGLKDTSPIKKAMEGVSDVVASSMSPSFGGRGSLAGAGGPVTNTRSLSVTINNPQAETGSDSLTRTTRNLAYLGLA